MKRISQLILLGIVCFAGSFSPSFAQEAKKGPLVRISEDLQQGISRATLTDSQKSELNADLDTLKQAREARQSGESVDRGQVRKALKSIQKYVNSGVFQAEDQKALQQDFESLRNR